MVKKYNQFIAEYRRYSNPEFYKVRGMYVTCLDASNEGDRNKLTVGKDYKILRDIKNSVDEFWYIRNDSGRKDYYFNQQFSEPFKKEKTNEELSFKKAAVGAAIALSTLAGCDSPNNTSANDQSVSWSAQPSDSTKSNVDLPNSFKMTSVILTIGTDMDITSNGTNCGKVEQRILKLRKTFEYFDSSGTKKAIGEQKILSIGTHIDIYDENHKYIGCVDEEVLKNLLSWKTHYLVKDASNNIIGESDMLDLLSTNLDLKDPQGNIIATMHRPFINILRDNWTINITGNIDKRLIVFIPSYKTSADKARRKSNSSSDGD